MAPDGVTQSVIAINNEFPGPLIEANWGDWISVTVTNEIWDPGEGLTMHWHGLDQRGTPWMDGVAALSHCPIAPGSTFTYTFRADHYGTTWYHSHYSSQYSAGVLGPMVIHGPVQMTAGYDIDLGPIMLQDWYHDSYQTIITNINAGGVTNPQDGYRPSSDSNLINGKGYYPCANVTNGATCGNAGLATFNFTSGKAHRLRFINSGSEAFQAISIDNHTMTVIANDFIPVLPYETGFVTLGAGQRTDVIVHANGDASEAYWLRVWNSPGCGDTLGPDGRAVIFYAEADQTILPTTTGLPTPPDASCANDPLSLTVPVYVEPVAEPDTTLWITLTAGLNDTGSVQFFMNDIAYRGDLSDPVLPDALSGETWFPAARNIYSTDTNQTVRIVFQNAMPAAHSMHLHGHDMQILAEGIGSWDGNITNPHNPQRRDAHMSWGGRTLNPTDPAYMVIQYTADNPGVWPFHCHVAWHVSQGMALMLGEQPGSFAGLYAQMPPEVEGLCASWDAFTSEGDDMVGDDDSTLKKLKGRSKVTMAMSDEGFVATLSEVQRREVGL